MNYVHMNLITSMQKQQQKKKDRQKGIQCNAYRTQ